MRISDWSSDVCSSDLNQSPAADVRRRHLRYFGPCDGSLRGEWQSQYARQGAAVALGRGAPETVRFRDGGRGEPHLPPPPRTRPPAPQFPSLCGDGAEGADYGGWESDTLAGHTLGHNMTALV